MIASLVILHLLRASLPCFLLNHWMTGDREAHDGGQYQFLSYVKLVKFCRLKRGLIVQNKGQWKIIDCINHPVLMNCCLSRF